MSTNIVARVPEDIAGDIVFFAQQEQVDKSTEIRTLLAQAMQEKRKSYALLKYQQREVTLAKAAKIARVPVAEMLRLTVINKIPLHYTEKDLREDFAAVLDR